jgi:type I restriction enzyme M protein
MYLLTEKLLKISISVQRCEPLEEYYKWQFIYALIHSGLYARDYIGAEVRFPKGNKASNPLKIDGAIFDDPDWIQHYNDSLSPRCNPTWVILGTF